MRVDNEAPLRLQKQRTACVVHARQRQHRARHRDSLRFRRAHAVGHVPPTAVWHRTRTPRLVWFCFLQSRFLFSCHGWFHCRESPEAFVNVNTTDATTGATALLLPAPFVCFMVSFESESEVKPSTGRRNRANCSFPSVPWYAWLMRGPWSVVSETGRLCVRARQCVPARVLYV